MSVLEIQYEGRTFLLDIEDMTTEDARAIERFGIPNLLALEDGMKVADVKSITAYYWLCLVQNGEPGARIERVQCKPLKFLKALRNANVLGAEDEEGKAEAE